METIVLNIIELEQHIGNIYLSKIDGNLLYKMSKADILRITNHEIFQGIQRDLKKSRVKQIKEYLKTEFSSFPNSIILNLSSSKIVRSSDDKLEVEISPDTFTIIDGQHRLAGFEDGDIENFELPIAIFIDLQDYNQALLFSTINSEQVKVDPSQKMSLELYSRVNTPKKVVTELAYAFNLEPESPWYKRIKLAGKKDELSSEGIIALKTFATPIIELIYNDTADNYRLRSWLNRDKNPNDFYDNLNEEKYIFWKFYANGKEKFIYNILMNYFIALSRILKNDWGNSESVLTKSTGYNAILKLFKDMYPVCVENGYNFSVDYMMSLLSPLSELEGRIDSATYGGSGFGASNYLYKDMKEKVNF